MNLYKLHQVPESAIKIIYWILKISINSKEYVSLQAEDCV